MPKGSIKTLFVASIILLTGILLSIQTFINISQFKGGMETQVKATLEGHAGEIAGKLDQRILQVAQKTSGLALGVVLPTPSFCISGCAQWCPARMAMCSPTR